MLFNSFEFLFVFLPIVFFLYFYLLQKRLIVGAKALLVFSSLFFYSWWNIAYLPLMLTSIFFNFIVGNALNENINKVNINKNLLLGLGVLSNIALLAYFKYSDFLIENFNGVFDAGINLLNLTLPLAISFFTFQQIAYLVDSYYGETSEYDFLNYTLFVSFFPQLIAGPIVHHAEMMPQFFSRWNLVKNYRNISLGIFIFSVGLFKKIVIADTFSKWAIAGFDHSESLNIFEAWATSFSYTFQLYFDFSAYTDMAIGIALLFNIKLPINFNSPYQALDIRDFWRRWHITLSRFLRDYVYIPLGGNRHGDIRTYVNLFSTFIIGGLWHGAGWMFVIWGALHGIALIAHRLWEKAGVKLNKWIAWFVTFNFVNITWIFFRAQEWADAKKVLTGMVDFDIKLSSYVLKDVFENVDGNSQTLIYIIIGFVIVLFLKNMSAYRQDFTANIKSLCISFALLFYSVLSLNKISEFLYFNF